MLLSDGILAMIQTRIAKVVLLLSIVVCILLYGYYQVRKDPLIDYALASRGYAASVVANKLGRPILEIAAADILEGDATKPLLPGYSEPPLRPFRTLRAYRGKIAVIFAYFDEHDEVAYVYISWP